MAEILEHCVHGRAKSQRCVKCGRFSPPVEIRTDGLKECLRCHQVLALVWFNKDRIRPDGHHSYCKDCTNAKDRGYYQHRLAKGVKVKSGKHPRVTGLKYIARSKSHFAIQSGKIPRQPCEVCGAAKVHGHHDDYTKPLELRWLCPKHHSEHHRVVRRAQLEAALTRLRAAGG